MSEGIRRSLGAFVAVTAVFAVAALSRVPYGLEERGGAVLRLSWRIIGERVEECRPLTPEEEARIPRHMRPPEICEGEIAPYALTLWLNGEVSIRDTLRGAGAREDRPIYVFREIDLRPGAHRVKVHFRPLLEGEKRGSLEFEETLSVAPGEVVLLTYDAGQGEWSVRRAGDGP